MVHHNAKAQRSRIRRDLPKLDGEPGQDRRRRGVPQDIAPHVREIPLRFFRDFGARNLCWNLGVDRRQCKVPETKNGFNVRNENRHYHPPRKLIHFIKDTMHEKQKCRVLYLGSSVPQQTKDGLQGIQEPLQELYPDQGATGARGIDSWLSVWSNGILLENVDENHKKITRFFPIESLHYCAAVR
ncbi:hypothetical protein Trydic_g23254 [Trypoxylus dichotomus]